jgi:hypothetical protein
MNIPKVKVIINAVDELELQDVTDIDIKLNRVVDDLQTPDKKFFEYSFTLTVPFTKINNRIMNHINEFDKDKKFRVTDFNARIYVNSKKIFDGILRINSLTDQGYKCKFFSKAVTLFDSLKSKKLNEANFSPISWSYEATIRSYCNNEYSPLDNTSPIQFPMAFYRTWYTPADYMASVGYTAPAYESVRCKPDYNLLLMENTFNNGGVKYNTSFYQQFPPAVFVYSIIKQIFQDAGWGVSSSWLEMDTTKRLIVPYNGDNSVWDRGNGLSLDGTQLYPGKFLPDMKQSEFLAGLINMFNLYVIVDADKQQVTLETYNNLFGDTYNPYDITDKVFEDTVEIAPADTRTVTFTYNDDDLNKDIVGLKRANSNLQPLGGSYNPYSTIFDKYNTTDKYNYANKTSDANLPFNKEIKIPFSATNMVKVLMYNYEPWSGATNNTYVGVELLLPMMSDQTLGDNSDNCFSEATGTTYLNNSPALYKYDGNTRILIWHGHSTSNYKVRYLTGGGGSGSLGSAIRKDYCWVNHGYPFAAGVAKMRLNFASFQGYPSVNVSPQQVYNRAIVYNDYSGSTVYPINDVFNAHYCVEMEQTIGEGRSTEYSLSLSDSFANHQTLYNRFHKAKWENFRYNEVLSADMRMTERDWIEMHVARTIRYRKQLYRIVGITAYNPILQTASIELNRFNSSVPMPVNYS